MLPCPFFFSSSGATSTPVSCPSARPGSPISASASTRPRCAPPPPVPPASEDPTGDPHPARPERSPGKERRDEGYLRGRSLLHNLLLPVGAFYFWRVCLPSMTRASGSLPLPTSNL